MDIVYFCLGGKEGGGGGGGGGGGRFGWSGWHHLLSLFRICLCLCLCSYFHNFRLGLCVTMS